jgi:hypothetical protein
MRLRDSAVDIAEFAILNFFETPMELRSGMPFKEKTADKYIYLLGGLARPKGNDVYIYFIGAREKV